MHCQPGGLFYGVAKFTPHGRWPQHAHAMAATARTCHGCHSAHMPWLPQHAHAMAATARPCHGCHSTPMPQHAHVPSACRIGMAAATARTCHGCHSTHVPLAFTSIGMNQAATACACRGCHSMRMPWLPQHAHAMAATACVCHALLPQHAHAITATARVCGHGCHSTRMPWLPTRPQHACTCLKHMPCMAAACVPGTRVLSCETPQWTMFVRLCHCTMAADSSCEMP